MNYTTLALLILIKQLLPAALEFTTHPLPTPYLNHASDSTTIKDTQPQARLVAPSQITNNLTAEDKTDGSINKLANISPESNHPIAPDRTAIIELISPTTGRIWMDRNLGASRAAISKTDDKAYGSLFQWCQPSNGQEKIHWFNSTKGRVAHNSLSDHSIFLSKQDHILWTASKINSNLWWNGSSVGVNNPCPTGYHVPTYDEWNAESASYRLQSGGIETMANRLWLPKAGSINGNYAQVQDYGELGYYWSSSKAWNADMSAGFVYLGKDYTPVNGNTGTIYTARFSVRCIKDL